MLAPHFNAMGEAGMAKMPGELLALALVLPTPAFAVTVDQATFRKYGGNLADIDAGIRCGRVFESLREHSYAKPWAGVGKISFGGKGCTGTWIGEDGDWSYVLSAAHCFGESASAAAPASLTFTGPRGVIADGQGTVYVPPERIGNAALRKLTDIAVVKLPRRMTPTDGLGVPLEKPVLNDSTQEDQKTVVFVGYGDWGVAHDVRRKYQPRMGEQRLYARNIARTTSIDGEGRGWVLITYFDPHGPSSRWGRLVPGDSGSAWWQFQNDKPTIAAVTAGIWRDGNYATRISRYVDWIKHIYPSARLLSEEGLQGCLVLADASRRTYCLGPGQSQRLPDWMRGRSVEIQADSGITVTLPEGFETEHGRFARFSGTVENSALRQAIANTGELVDLSRPWFMQVDRAVDKPLGCVISLVSAEKYCLPPDHAALRQLPAWISGHDVFVQADPGVAVVLFDEQSRAGKFSGLVQNHDLKQVSAANGVVVDLSQPAAMYVVRETGP